MYVVLCNCPVADAPAIARRLVESGRAACVNILPVVTSVYRWDGALCEAQEVPLLIKVSAENLPGLRELLVELHPFEVPEFVALPVDTEASLAAYVRWVRGN